MTKIPFELYPYEIETLKQALDLMAAHQAIAEVSFERSLRTQDLRDLMDRALCGLTRG